MQMRAVRSSMRPASAAADTGRSADTIGKTLRAADPGPADNDICKGRRRIVVHQRRGIWSGVRPVQDRIDR
jgi:hypothetical protein